MSGGNAGITRPRVWILDKSPFNSFRKQENCFYITKETFYTIQKLSHIVPLNQPINGCRLEENRVSYDNYLVDRNGVRLEKSPFLTTTNVVNPETGKEEPVQTYSEFDGTASARVKLKELGEKETPEAEKQRKFFTWKSQTSIFGDYDRIFENGPQFDSVPEWTYINIPKPTVAATTQNTLMKAALTFTSGFTGLNKASIDALTAGTAPRILMPYQRKIPKDKSTPVHWSLKMIDRPYNQPFELTHYICFRDASVADLAPEQRTTTTQTDGNKFSFHYKDEKGNPGKQINLKLNKGLYLGIEIGEDDPQHHYLFLFNYGQKPMLFLIDAERSGSDSGASDTKTNTAPCPVTPKTDSAESTKQNDSSYSQNGKSKAMLVAVYDGADTIVETMFSSKIFTISFESAGGMLYLRCSAFPKSWVIHPNVMDRNGGLFIGRTLSVYGGNIQAGIAYAPIQYHPTGDVTMAGVVFDVPDSAPNPTVSVSTMGTAQILQDQTRVESYEEESQERLMADTESLQINNGDTPEKLKKYGLVNSLLGKNMGDVAGISRLIKVSLSGSEKNPDPEGADALLGNSNTDAGCEELQANTDVAVFDAFGSPRGLLAYRTGTTKPQTWYPTIAMTASAVPTATGFVIPSGRSPYLWLIRIGIEPDSTPVLPEKKFDLTGDVMSVDLSWNSTGPGEITCSGSIKVLASPRAPLGENALPNLMKLTTRISYIQIEVERKASVIPDAESTKDDKRIFTGCIVGADVQEEPGKTVINFKVEDYMWALSAMKFNLSPFYDGMFYNYAVADMVAQTGLPYSRMYFDSGSLIATKDVSGPNLDDMPSLPCTNMFEQPQFRFKDGEALKDGITRIAKMDWKMVYFDAKGDFHYDSIPWGMTGVKTGNYAFEFFTGNSDGWTPENLVWNNVSLGYAMKDMYNALQVITVSKAVPSIYLLYQDINRDSLDDPESIGYIGFPKVIRQKDAIFERAETAYSYFLSLKKMLYLPPRTIKFETYGRVGLRPASVVSVDGNPWRLMNISLKMDASKNEFWASCEGEWFDQKVEPTTATSTT